MIVLIIPITLLSIVSWGSFRLAQKLLLSSEFTWVMRSQDLPRQALWQETQILRGISWLTGTIALVLTGQLSLDILARLLLPEMYQGVTPAIVGFGSSLMLPALWWWKYRPALHRRLVRQRLNIWTSWIGLLSALAHLLMGWSLLVSMGEPLAIARPSGLVGMGILISILGVVVWPVDPQAKRRRKRRRRGYSGGVPVDIDHD